MRRILSSLRRAVDDYNMIEDGDKIAVGLSGGKDSLVLLYALSALRRFYPKKFELGAITLDLGFENFDAGNLVKICEEENIDYHIEKTYISEIVFNVRKEKNPCSLCANLRRGVLYDTVSKMGYNKVALGHHMDDVIETFFMSLIYEGRVHTFSPITYLDRKNINIIRPLVYLPEKEAKAFVKKQNLEVLPVLCPVDGKTKREYIKNLVYKIEKENYKSRESIFGAIKRSEGWNRTD